MLFIPRFTIGAFLKMSLSLDSVSAVRFRSYAMPVSSGYISNQIYSSPRPTLPQQLKTAATVTTKTSEPIQSPIQSSRLIPIVPTSPIQSSRVLRVHPSTKPQLMITNPINVVPRLPDLSQFQQSEQYFTCPNTDSIASSTTTFSGSVTATVGTRLSSFNSNVSSTGPGGPGVSINNWPKQLQQVIQPPTASQQSDSQSPDIKDSQQQIPVHKLTTLDQISRYLSRLQNNVQSYQASNDDVFIPVHLSTAEQIRGRFKDHHKKLSVYIPHPDLCTKLSNPVFEYCRGRNGRFSDASNSYMYVKPQELYRLDGDNLKQEPVKRSEPQIKDSESALVLHQIQSIEEARQTQQISPHCCSSQTSTLYVKLPLGALNGLRVMYGAKQSNINSDPYYDLYSSKANSRITDLKILWGLSDKTIKEDLKNIDMDSEVDYLRVIVRMYGFRELSTKLDLEKGGVLVRKVLQN